MKTSKSGLNVLSLFDGMSCGQIALQRAGVSVENYYASEIDKYPMQVTQQNFPDTKQIGDVTQVESKDLPKIDLLMGGSPCQGFSFAGKQLNFDDPRSKLFFEFVRLLNQCNPKYFLLENVKMKKEYEAVISEHLGVEPVEINSSLVSAQNRKRLYWTNIAEITSPKDKGIHWGDVREHNVPWGSMYYTPSALKWIGEHGKRKDKKLKVHADGEKMQMLEASHCKKYSSQRFFGIIDSPAGDMDAEMAQAISKVQYPDVFDSLPQGEFYRYITPLECERLQTIPDNFTASVSNTQRYKMLGNGWTVDVIAHIFKNLNN